MSVWQLPTGKWRAVVRRTSCQLDITCPDEESARAAVREALDSAARKPKDTQTFAQAAAMLLVSREFKAKPPNTQRTEEGRLGSVLKHKISRLVVRYITPEHVREYIDDALERTRKYAGHSIRLEVAAISSVFGWLVDRRALAANPTHGVKKPVGKSRVRRWSAADEGHLLTLLVHDRPRVRKTALFMLLVRELGCRPGELQELEIKNVEFKKQTIFFAETKYTVNGVRQPRKIPATEQALRWLLRAIETCKKEYAHRRESARLQIAHSPYVFSALTRRGTAGLFHYSSAVRDLVSAGLISKGLGAHIGRHEFISSLVEDSDIEDSRIMAVVGQHSPASMKIYSHARAVRLLPAIEAHELETRGPQRVAAVAEALGLSEEDLAALVRLKREPETSSVPVVAPVDAPA